MCVRMYNIIFTMATIQGATPSTGSGYVAAIRFDTFEAARGSERARARVVIIRCITAAAAVQRNDMQYEVLRKR